MIFDVPGDLMNDTKDIKSSPISSLKSELAFNLENKNVDKVHIIGEGSIDLFERISESFLTLLHTL